MSGSDDVTIHIRNASTGMPVGEPLCGHIAEVRSVAFSCNGNHIISGAIDGTVRCWDADLSTGLRRKQYAGHSAPVQSVAYSPDGQ